MDANEAALPQPEAIAPTLSFAGHITKVSESSRPKSMAFLGKFKSGKTTLAASACRIPGLVAAGKDVLILEAETGTASIAEQYPEVDQLAVPSIQLFNKAVNELLTVPHNYGVVIVDTFDKFQEMEIDHALMIGAANTQAAWGDVKDWTIRTAWALHKAPFLVIFLFHETTDKDAQSAKWETGFAIQGGAKNKLGQVFDLIGHLTVRTDANGKAVRTLQVGPQTGNVTGSRYESSLPSAIDDPTIPAIFEMIESHRNNNQNEGQS